MANEVDRKEMNTSSEALRGYATRHMSSTAILATLGAVLDTHVTGTPLDPTLRTQINEVLDALGIGGITEGLSAADLRPMLAEIRFNMLLDAKLLVHASRSLAWTHTETEILQAGGEVSAGFADALTHTIVPRLDGLEQRLGSPDGSFLRTTGQNHIRSRPHAARRRFCPVVLNIGVGVAGLVQRG